MANPPPDSSDRNGKSVCITFSRKGILPPVYISASFTDPAWEPAEMDFKKPSASSDFQFSKTLEMVKAGELEYKFRLGPADEDSWILDDNAPTRINGDHKNNFLTSEPSSSAQAPPTTEATQIAKKGAMTPTLPETKDNEKPLCDVHFQEAPTPKPPFALQSSTSSTPLLFPTLLDEEARDHKLVSHKALVPAESPTPSISNVASIKAAVTLPRLDGIINEQDPCGEAMQARYVVDLRDDLPSDLSTDAAVASSLPATTVDPPQNQNSIAEKVLPMASQQARAGTSIAAKSSSPILAPTDQVLAKLERVWTGRSIIDGGVPIASVPSEEHSQEQPGTNSLAKGSNKTVIGEQQQVMHREMQECTESRWLIPETGDGTKQPFHMDRLSKKAILLSFAVGSICLALAWMLAQQQL